MAKVQSARNLEIKSYVKRNIGFFQSADFQNNDSDVAYAIEAAADAGAAAGAREATGGVPAELAAAETSCRTAQTSAAYAIAHYWRGCSTTSIASMYCHYILTNLRERSDWPELPRQNRIAEYNYIQYI